jgi:hypothetical protein
VADLVKVRGDWHPEVLANGRTVAPGEPFEHDLLDPERDARLVGEGILIDAIVTPVPLSGDELRDRAKALAISGRASMSADELREAVALAEASGGDTAQPADDTQRMGA